ncbi:hypothetical protein FIBSPDRAFT_956459 [Athelia psychrophila]|uniref:Uncharacterized protein n=1 Tax=Athelia psychrophila TaxID=1759441 RepID=A0A166GYH4_9AGAM|nr:hypothetical protein FIBSPDRAFT_956459 [Fibularhizoctonia sp. CBS 109695]
MADYPLIHDELMSQGYANTSAADSHINVLRAKSHSYRSTTTTPWSALSGRLLVELNNGMGARTALLSIRLGNEGTLGERPRLSSPGGISGNSQFVAWAGSAKCIAAIRACMSV